MKIWSWRIFSGIVIVLTLIGFLFNFLDSLKGAGPSIAKFMEQPVVIIFDIVFFMIGFLVYLSNEFTSLKQSIKENHDRIHATISSIKGILPNGKETDVVRKLLKMQLGDIAETILPTDASFPVTLVPGGDVALIMDQIEYSKTLENLLSAIQNNQEYKICWTTFVPFESLNKSLSGYTSDQWIKRLEREGTNFRPATNDKFFKYISQWASIKGKGRQIIILDTTMTDKEDYLIHPLNYKKYLHGGKFNLDLIKYLCVRYGIENNIKSFIDFEETYFLNDNLKNEVKKQDESNNNVKWCSLVDAQNITEQIQREYIQKIYNIDFVYFDKPGNDFTLVRVDADNSFSTDGGIVGVTFVVFTSRSLSLYSKLFNKMFKTAQETFSKLTNGNL